MSLIFLSNALLAAVAAITLIDLPAPNGSAYVVRVVDASGGRTFWLNGEADTVAELGADFIPTGWSADGQAVLGYRVSEDGHDVLAAVPERRTPGGAPQVWSGGPGGLDAALARLADSSAAASASGRAATPGAAPTRICIDAGHGGPGAAQWNGNNGDAAGAHGPGGLTEQWVNLRVSGLLLDRLKADSRFAGSFRTRSFETQFVSLADRVLMAAQGGAALFVSIHHNGLPAGSPNRTETYYCLRNPACPDPDSWSRPAWLLHDRIVAAFGYSGRGALEDSSGSGRFHFYVLKNSPVISVLCESSNLNGDVHEEDLFGRDQQELHAKAEAFALHQGILAWFGYPTAVEEPPGRPAPFELAEPVWSADGSRARLAWSASDARPLEVVLVDVQGRRRRELGWLQGPGAGVLDVPVRAAGRSLEPGVYWVVLTAGGTVRVSRRLSHSR